MNNRNENFEKLLSTKINNSLMKLCSVFTPNTHVKIQNVLWAAFTPGLTIWDDYVAEKGQSIQNAFDELYNMHCYPHRFCKLHGYPAADKDVMRLYIYSKTIEFLHHYFGDAYPNRQLTDASHLKGMEKIRALFKDYLTITWPASLERYQLAHEIMMEKRKYCLPCSVSAGQNMYELNCGFAPGDFSRLDFSNMAFARPKTLGDGGFKALKVDYTNFTRTTFDNICLIGANFEGAILQEADLSKCKLKEDIILNNANLHGAYLERDDLQDRKHVTNVPINRSTPSQSYHYIAPAPQPSPQVRYDQYVTGSFENDMRRALDESLSYTQTQSLFAPSSSVSNATRQTQAQNQEAPQQYYCPITKDIMKKPVLCLLDGHTYDEPAIKKWLEQHRESPMTREKMPNSYSVNSVLVRNLALESLIDDFNAKNNNNPRPS